MRYYIVLVMMLEPALGQPTKGVEVRGEYKNRAGYAYHVTVPAGLVGHRMPAPAPARGFMIRLGPSAENNISVDGSYNAAEYSRAEEVAQRTVAWIRGEANSVDEPRFHDVTLAGLPAVELIVRYTDKKTRAIRMCRSVSAIRRIKPTDTVDVIYEVWLNTSAERFAQDGIVYETLVKSFRLDPQ